MQSIAPDIKRQRLLIEGFYGIDVNENAIKEFFSKIISDLNLKAYGDPIIFSPQSLGKEENQGYDAFIPLIDSGISLYVWTSKKFLSIVIYTCKDFDEEQAISSAKEFFNIETYVSKPF